VLTSSSPGPGPTPSGAPTIHRGVTGARRAVVVSPASLALLAALVLTLLGLVLAPGRAAAAPGVPAAPRTVYTEDFENAVGTTPVLLTGYTGASGQTYTADAPWLTACNGVVLPFAAPDAAQAAAGCATTGNYSHVRQIAYALGGNTTNHAVSAYTENNPGVDAVQFETTTPIALAAKNRFIAFSVDAAETNCFANHALYKFYLLNGGAEIPTFTTPIEPCADPTSRAVTAPTVGGLAAGTYQTGTFASNRAVLFSGADLGIRMRNGQASGSGNDAGFDNIRVLDATPQLDKSFSRTDLGIGQASRLTFTVTNTSELGAKQGWSFTDNLSAGLRVADPASVATTCTNGTVTAPAGGGTVAVTGDLDQGQAACTVSVDVTASNAGTYTNGPSNFDPLVGLDPPPPATITFRAADLSIVKSSTPTVATPGTNQSYTLTVKNNGPDTAQAVRVSDALPAGVAFVSASPECSLVGATVACALPSMASGETRTFTVQTKVASSLSSRLTNTATVASDTPDPDPANNTSTVVVPIEGKSDLSITKTPSVRTIGPNGQVLYTLVVKNNGPSDATGVTVTDAAPAGLTLQSAKGGSGTTCGVEGNQATCRIGTLASGGTAQVLVTAQTTASAVGDLTNRATVTGNEQDPTPGNNTGTSTVTVPPPPGTPQVQPTAELAITKKVNTRNIRLGRSLTYTVVVTNNGPSVANDVVVTDTLAVPARNVSIKASAGKCTGTVPFTCRLGTIQPGKKVTITVKLTPTTAGTARNTASVTSPGTDPKTDNNIAGVSTTVAKPTLGLTKAANRKAVKAGQTVTYTLRVRNPSSAPVKDVKVCDNLPSGLVYVSSKSRAKLTKGQYCWTVGSLGAGKSRTFTLTARALKGTSGTKTNRATASSPDARTKRASRSVRVTRTALRAGGVTG
jgi:uncharacterized repeat protein (TIGR01451 family)